MDPSEAESRVLQLCESFKQGITYKIIQNDLPHLQLTEIVPIINKLLSKGKVDLHKKADDSLIIKLKNDLSGSQRLKGVDPEEQLVYKIIEESGTQGIWAKDIRMKSNLHLNTVDKMLRKLDGKKLIKSFTSVASPKKKRYIIFNLEPDRELMGGAWYSELQFDAEFVDILNQQCYKFLEQKASRAKQVEGGPIAVDSASYVSSKDVLNYITELGIAKVELRLEEIESILNTLVYDGKASKTISGDGANIYKAVNFFTGTNYFAAVPCGVCPMIAECDEVGSVTPVKCEYLKEWLNF